MTLDGACKRILQASQHLTAATAEFNRTTDQKHQLALHESGSVVEPCVLYMQDLQRQLQDLANHVSGLASYTENMQQKTQEMSPSQVAEFEDIDWLSSQETMSEDGTVDLDVNEESRICKVATLDSK